jgi:hypothetical protein
MRCNSPKSRRRSFVSGRASLVLSSNGGIPNGHTLSAVPHPWRTVHRRKAQRYVRTDAGTEARHAAAHRRPSMGTRPRREVPPAPPTSWTRHGWLRIHHSTPRSATLELQFGLQHLLLSGHGDLPETGKSARCPPASGLDGSLHPHAFHTDLFATVIVGQPGISFWNLTTLESHD